MIDVVVSNVRLIPKTALGRLKFNPEAEDIAWLSPGSEDHLLKLKECRTIFIDQISSTVLISYPENITMLHFLDGEESIRLFVLLLEGQMRDSLSSLENQDSSSRYITFTPKALKPPPLPPNESDLDEATLNVLEAFSKVPMMAKSILQRLQGQPQYLHRPRGINNNKKKIIPLNPWIFNRPLQLPDTRMSRGPILSQIENFSKLDPKVQATMIYNSCGRILLRESRPQFWIDSLLSDDLMFDLEGNSISSEENLNRIEKDLCRLGVKDTEILDRVEFILSRHCLMDEEVGYVQGMADLALPFARAFQDQSLALKCFYSLMRSLRCNFLESTGEDGMDQQLAHLRDVISQSAPLLCEYLKFNRESDSLFFAYRWLLVLFRRELDFNEADRLWDVMFAGKASGVASISEFKIYFALAMILVHRDTFMRTCSRFEDLLIFFNEMSGKWDLDELLILTDRLIMHFKDNKK